MRLLVAIVVVLCTSCIDDGLVVLHPSGAGDDGPIISRALKSGRVELAAGEFIVRTPIVVPSGADLSAHPETVIHSYLVGTGPGGYRQSTFYAAARTGKYVSALLLDAEENKTTLVTKDPPKVGMWIRVSNPMTHNVAQVFRVLAVDGRTAHLDREVQFGPVFLANSLVEEIHPPRNIRLRGNGATIIGGGDRAFELSATQSSLIQGWNVRGTFQSIVISFDIGSADSVIGNVFVDGGMVASAGVALEGCYRCAILGATVRNTSQGPSNPGIYVVDSVDSVVLADVEGCGVGIQIASGATNNPTVAGSRRVTVFGRFDDSAHFGAQVTTAEIAFRGASFSWNQQIGINVDFGEERNRPSGGAVVLSDVRGEYNGGPLLVLRGGSVVAERLDSLNDGLRFQNRAIDVRPGNGNLELKSSSLRLGEDVFWWGIHTAGDGRLTIESSSITLPPQSSGTNAGIVVRGRGLTEAFGTSISGGHFGVYVFGNGATFKADDSLQIDSKHPITILDGSTLITASVEEVGSFLGERFCRQGPDRPLR